MNICIISPRYPYKGNMEFVFVKKIVDEWAKSGHRCVVITNFSLITYMRKRIEYKPYHYQDEIAPGVTVDIYNPRIITTKGKVGTVSINGWVSSQAIGHQIEKLKISFDFIYCHFIASAIYAFQYAKKNNVPLFVATGESGIPIPNKPNSHFTFDGFKNYIKGVIAVSSKNKNEAAKLGLIDPLKCQVFPNGTDLAVFHPMDRGECRKILNLPHDVFIISCVGFLCERKGQNRLLEAVKKIGNSNIKLLFLGKSAALESFSLEGDEILFKGTVDNKEIPKFLCASDIFCLPTRAEGCCNAVIEALACGLPVISSNLPFNWDVLDDRNSILVDPDNIDEIGYAISQLYDNVSLRKKLSNAAELKGQQLDLKNRASSILSFVKSKL